MFLIIPKLAFWWVWFVLSRVSLHSFHKDRGTRSVVDPGGVENVWIRIGSATLVEGVVEV